MSTLPPNSLSGFSRRDAFRIGLGTIAAAIFAKSWQGEAFAQSAPAASPTPAPTGPYKLPPLPYAYDALEPAIDERTMHLHHDKHHAAYVNNANALLVGQAELSEFSPEEMLKNLNKAPETIRTGLRNNVGGHVNHSLFWLMMSPKGGGAPTGPIASAIAKKFGSFDNFQKQFNEAATKRFGSGWAWLIVNKEGQLEIISTANQDCPIMDGQIPLLGLDVWEHAYYLKYQNLRADYIKNWWNVVNWEFVNKQFVSAKKA